MKRQVAQAERSRISGWLRVVVLIALAGASVAAKNIFDDDWSPPAPAPTPALTPAPTPTPAPAPAPAAVPPADAGNAPVTPPPVASVAPAPSIATVRLAVPAKTDRTKSRQMLKEVYSKELADISVQGRDRLAKTLLSAAAQSLDAPSDHFVLLSGAMDAAQEAADLPVYFQSADAMMQRYAVDLAAMKAQAVAQVVPKQPPANRDANLKASLAILSDLEKARDWAAVQKVGAALQPAVRDAATRADVLKKVSSAKAHQAAEASISKARKQLADAPDEPAANLAVGSYECCEKGNWAMGLPLLCKAGDAALAELAKRDIAASKATNGGEVSDSLAASLADAWWNASEKQPSLSLKKLELARAGIWYQQNLPAMDGLLRVSAEKRIAQAPTPAWNPTDANLAVGIDTSSRPNPYIKEPLRIEQATYGDGDRKIDFSATLAQQATVEPFLCVGADNTLGDPADGVVKTLTVRYVVDGAPAQLQLQENSAAALPPIPDEGIALPGNGGKFQIVAARFGIGAKWADATATVRAQIHDPAQTIGLTDAPPDPAWGVHKHWVIWFNYKGRRYVQIRQDDAVAALIDPSQR